MSISPSTMKCPSCEEQTLETVSAPLGTWERCPTCSGLFIHQDIVTAASPDRAKCVEALEETKVLLLPTERWCPKCLQKLFDGRVQSRGVIFSLCTACQSLWTSLPILRQFDELIEKTLRMQVELASATPSQGAAIPGVTTPPVNMQEDSGIARIFRSSARLFDRMADTVSKGPDEESLKEKKPKKPVKQDKPAEPVKPAEPEPPPSSPKIEVPEFIFPEEPIVEEKAAPSVPKIEPEPAPPPARAPVIEPVKEVVPPTPKPAEKKPVPVVVKGPGFFARFKAAWSPKPKKTAPSAKPVEPVKVVKPTEPVKVVKPVAVPKPKKEKPPKEPFDARAFWPPWAFGILAVILSAFREFGFEGVPAILWGVMGWSSGMMVRLARLYPFKSFQETTLQTLAESKASPGWRGIPVALKGQIVPAREENPKGEVVFKQDDRTLRLNHLGRWDLIPRLFGLSNPRQLLKGEVALQGWYRAGLTPSLEVHEVRADKTFRKSMVRMLRWFFAVMVFVVALVIYLSLD